MYVLPSAVTVCRLSGNAFASCPQPPALFTHPCDAADFGCTRCAFARGATFALVAGSPMQQQTLQCNFTAPSAFSILPALPPGLSFDSVTGTLSGMAASALSETIYTITPTSSNQKGSTPLLFALSVVAPASVSCVPGTGLLSSGWPTCSTCPVGRYSDTNTANRCVACPQNTFSYVVPSAAVNASAAISAAPGATECTACPANSFANGNRTNCFCQTGDEANKTNSC